MKSALKMSVKDDAQTREEIARLTDDELRALTKDAFFWGMHPVAMYELRYVLTQLKSGPSYVGDGRMHWDRRPRSAADKSATAPNATTLYGMGFFDLRREPVIVAIPAVAHRYFSVQACDQYPRWFMTVGNQFTGRDVEVEVVTSDGDTEAPVQVSDFDAHGRGFPGYSARAPLACLGAFTRCSITYFPTSVTNARAASSDATAKAAANWYSL